MKKQNTGDFTWTWIPTELTKMSRFEAKHRRKPSFLGRFSNDLVTVVRKRRFRGLDNNGCGVAKKERFKPAKAKGFDYETMRELLSRNHLYRDHIDNNKAINEVTYRVVHLFKNAHTCAPGVVLNITTRYNALTPSDFSRILESARCRFSVCKNEAQFRAVVAAVGIKHRFQNRWELKATKRRFQ